MFLNYDQIFKIKKRLLILKCNYKFSEFFKFCALFAKLQRRMLTIKLILIYLASYSLSLINAQEPITNAQRIYEFLNYGPLGLLYGILPNVINSLNITDQCLLALNHTIDELHSGQVWSNLCKFKFVFFLR